jgi:DNA modification methylase
MKNKPKIEQIPVDALIPYARNSRTHSEAQVAQIAGSIREFGFTNPVLIDAENGIIAGHGRIMAAQKLGLAEVPCIRLDHLTETQRKAYVIADNKLALNSGWDETMLALELAELQDDNFDLSLTGFDESELADLLAETVEGETDPDEVPEPPVNPVTVQGDVWILGNHRLMCGDSTSIDAVEKLMDGQKADMVFTDPPYGVDYEGGHNKKKRQGIKNDALEGDSLTDLFHASISCAEILTHDHAAFYIWYANGKAVETFASFSRLTLKIRAVLCWYKVRSGLGAFMAQYIPNYEPCIYAHKDGCSPQWFGSTDEKTVWEEQRVGKNDYHPTQKPVELPERAIKNSSKSGDIILDLFGGSGSTLIAAEKNGRIARLMELDPKYCDVIIKRWQDFAGKKATHEASGKTFDEMKEQQEAVSSTDSK